MTPSTGQASGMSIGQHLSPAQETPAGQHQASGVSGFWQQRSSGPQQGPSQCEMFERMSVTQQCCEVSTGQQPSSVQTSP
jgi:hypothetical protein